MGNCQAAEAATVLIQHPAGRIERIYWSLTASQIMSANPGHYVAVIITAQPPPPNPPAASSSSAAPVKHLKLLRPDDTLRIGNVYRLVSFEEVLKEFASKKHVRLREVVAAAKERRRSRSKRRDGDLGADPGESSLMATEAATDGERGGEVAVAPPRVRQWRPALQSIEEVVGS